MLNLATILTLVLAAPFTDVQERFSVDLPEGWLFAPLPGDTSGAAFVKKSDASFASAAVRIVPVDPSSSAQVWVTALVKAVEREPGFKLQMKDDAKLGEANAARRRYAVFVDGDARRVKVAEDRVVVQKGLCVFVHVETLADGFPAFEPEFARIFGSFMLGKGRPTVADHGAVLVGRWLMEDTTDTMFDIRPDGSFDLGGVRGTYQVQGDLLITRQESGAVENFNYKVDAGQLILSSPNFEEPMRYSRVGSGPGGGGIAGPLLIGRWFGPGHKLELMQGGRMILDGKEGSYSVEGAILFFTIGGKKAMVGFTLLRPDALRLTGERFGKGADLRKK